MLTGRPVPIGNLYEQSSAVIAAWLPGTSGGQGIVDLISGAYVARPGGSTNRKNSLSVDWPRNMVYLYLYNRKLWKNSQFMVQMVQFLKCRIYNSQLVLVCRLKLQGNS